MNWFNQLFRRKPRPTVQGELIPAVRESPNVETGDTVAAEVPSDLQPPRPQPGPDIIGRQKGRKRNRVHVYRQPFGYPIRLCDWFMVETDDIEEVGRCQGLGGPAEMITLATALDWRENHGDRVCRHCKAVVTGKRSSMPDAMKARRELLSVANTYREAG